MSFNVTLAVLGMPHEGVTKDVRIGIHETISEPSAIRAEEFKP